ncbi:MAG: hypothetical protein C4319_08340 [Acidimicrobiia bacterium]
MERILYVTHQYLPYFPTGVARSTQTLATHMQKFGHQVAVLSVIPRGRNHEFEPTRYMYEGNEVWQFAPTRAYTAVPDHHWDIDTALVVASVIEELRPDIVDVQHPMMYPEARRVASACGLPTVVHLHDYWFLCPRVQLLRVDSSLCVSANAGSNCKSVCSVPDGEERMAWARAELEYFDAVVAPTRFVMETFSREGFATSSWILLPSGTISHQKKWQLGKQPMQRSKSPLRLRFLESLLHHKGAHILLAALAKIPGAPLRVFIHGDCYDETEYYKSLVELAAKDERVSFEGPYDFVYLPDLLSATDIVVIPSIWPETHSLVAESALASGVPVICTGPSGMSEIVKECEGGWEVPMGDAEALAHILEKIAYDPFVLERTAMRMRPPMRIEAEAVAMEAIYRTLLAGL